MLLDDPVQHIDDFRAIHLAEVLAQLVSAGRQVIVAVEDPALADMLCHRLPVTRPGAGWRISLGHLASGAAGIQNEYELKPLARRAFAGLPAIQAG
jgi:ABC-type cobalamin/Fe3+-siderophores transport system ATPase subunit